MKLNKLIPIIALPCITSVVAPIVTSCSTKDNESDVILLNQKDGLTLFSKKYSFKKDKIYTAKADWKNMKRDDIWNWNFVIVDIAKAERYNFVATNAKFWLNKTEYLLDVNREFEFSDGIFSGEHSTVFTAKDHFKFQFQVKEDVKANLSLAGVQG